MIKKLIGVIVLLTVALKVHAIANNQLDIWGNYSLWSNYSLTNKNVKYLSAIETRKHRSKTYETTYIYDKAGHLIHESNSIINGEQNIKTETVYEYADNKLIKITEKSPYGQNSRISIIKYSDKTKQILQSNVDPKTGGIKDEDITYTYNDNGLLIERDAPFEPSDEKFTYDKNGLLIYSEYLGDDSKTTIKITRTIDEKNKIKEEKRVKNTRHLEEKEVTRVTVVDYIYKGDNCVQEEKNEVTGSKKSLKELIKYEYDKNNEIKSEDHFDAKGQNIKKIVYTY
ncbi:MAG: hypothetical protein NTY45_15580 [Elusimicrobia bacterium]|nr:hypothetical protein [Elusimicrobiota bacterium]